MAEAYIVATARTAGGRKGGRLAGWHPVDLAASVLNSLVDRTVVDPAQIEDVIMGCVMQAGEQSNNVARNAVMASKLPESVPATSVDRQCGSSQQALHFAAQAVMAGSMDIVIAAGVEGMTRVPMGLPATLAAKNGFGNYYSPGIQARYPNIQFSQFTGAEMMAEKYGLSKEELDQYSYQSHQKAIAATQAGVFKDEIVPLKFTRDDGSSDIHNIDEGIRFEPDPVKMAQLKPAFKPGGGSWTVALEVAGEPRGEIEGVPLLYGMAPFEGLSVGRDPRSPVVWELFERFGANRYSGALDRVTIEPGEPAPDAPVNLMGLLRDIGLRFE